MGENAGISVRSILRSRICREEIMGCDEHEIVVKISNMLGEKPCDLCKAEEIFHAMKYDIARYIVAHEFCTCDEIDISEELIIWLDEKTSPQGVKILSETIEKYLK